MADLLLKPFGSHGKVHHVTPQSAGWRYVGFGLYRLRAGETAAEATGDTEVILVMVEGKARLTGAGQDWGVLGERMSVFEKTPPHSLYLPNGTDWTATAETDCVIAVCSAPGHGGHPARRAPRRRLTGQGKRRRGISAAGNRRQDKVGRRRRRCRERRYWRGSGYRVRGAALSAENHLTPSLTTSIA